MEPERKIEKLLRAYAQKRRTDAGEALKLHPATRRILQGEAARRAPAQAAPGREPAEGSVLHLLLALFRRRLVFALCVVGILAIGTALLLPGLSSAKRKAQNLSAANNLKEIGMATRQYASDNKDRLPVSLEEVTNALATSKVLIDPATGKPFVYAGAGKKLDGLQSNTVLAYSSAGKNGRAVLFADGRVETMNGERFAELTNQKPTELALADKSAHGRLVKATAAEPVAAATPAPALKTTSELEKRKTELAASLSFVQAGASNVQNLFRNDSASAQTTPVLQSFAMKQNGNAISIVDRDGSVYNGSIQLAHATADNEPISRESPATPPPAEGKAAQLAINEQQAVQYYFFRVAGTNRTLQQNVVFTGNVLANSSAPQTVQTSNFLGALGGGSAGGQLQQAAANASQQSLLSNSRIVGTAVIDRTNQIEINAVPVTQ